MKNNICIRQYKSSDLRQIVQLFKDTVHAVNKKDYSKEQLDAWAPEALDISKWKKSLQVNICFVAELEGKVVGFADMSKQGYLDRVYVHKDYQGRLIAKRLGKALLNEAIKLKIEEVTSDVSITALPLAKKLGFEVVRAQEVERRGTLLTNYQVRMRIKNKLTL